MPTTNQALWTFNLWLRNTFGVVWIWRFFSQGSFATLGYEAKRRWRKDFPQAFLRRCLTISFCYPELQVASHCFNIDLGSAYDQKTSYRRRMSDQETSNPELRAKSTSRFRRFVPDWRIVLRLLWLGGFLLLFFGCDCTSNPNVNRMDLLINLPGVLAETIYPLPNTDRTPSGFEYLTQRADLVLVAGIILAGAWAIGNLLLRLIVRETLDRGLERFVLAFGLGLSFLSVATLGLGLIGVLSRWVFLLILGLGLVVEAAIRIRRCCSGAESNEPQARSLSAAAAGRRKAILTYQNAFSVGRILVILAFLVPMVLGAMLPSVDFDVKEYHLQGPKEFLQQGHIGMLPHNVYTSFPFLTEMLSLLAMVIYGDWYWGALAGKLVLMSFAPLTALGLYAVGRRWFGPAVGWFAALIFLTTPWVYRISIIAYAEGGLTFFLLVTLLVLLLICDRVCEGHPALGLTLVMGLMAGSAMACKYPGILSTILPLGLGLFLVVARGSTNDSSKLKSCMRFGCTFAIGVVLTVGPWLLKNTIETGNPVYPLLYSVFGGADLSPELAEKWKGGHTPYISRIMADGPGATLTNLGTSIVDVSVKSFWISPLLFGLAPLAFLFRRDSVSANSNSKTIRWLWLYVGFLLGTWWLFTHHIDRFWVPLIPVVALLAAIGVCHSSSRLWRISCGTCIVLSITFNFAFITSKGCGYNAYLVDLDFARQFTAKHTAPAIEQLNQLGLDENSKVLSVGDAEVFDAKFPIIYHTVFDVCILEEWCRAEGSQGADYQLKTAEEIRQKFRDEGVKYVYVDWLEILRYRLPGSYGYTDFVTPQIFDRLQKLGVLQAPRPLGFGDFAELKMDQITEIQSWAPELIRTNRSVYGADLGRSFVTAELYPVVEE